MISDEFAWDSTNISCLKRGNVILKVPTNLFQPPSQITTYPPVSEHGYGWKLKFEYDTSNLAPHPYGPYPSWIFQPKHSQNTLKLT